MSEHADRLRECLEGRSGPVSAIEIAAALGIPGGHESRRRRVRERVKAARDAGVRVCANSSGCWLARSDAEWQKYKASVASGSRFTFVRLRDWTEAAVDRGNAQGELFANPRTGASSAWTR